MSSMSFVEGAAGLVTAWETREQVFFSHIDPVTSKFSEPISPPGVARKRKHPWLAANATGDLMLVWTENTGWAKGGDLAWQVFDKTGKPKGKQGRIEGIPAWTFGVAYAGPDGGFSVMY